MTQLVQERDRYRGTDVSDDAVDAIIDHWCVQSDSDDLLFAIVGSLVRTYQGELDARTMLTLIAQRIPFCRECGCTDDRACGEGCEWVEPGLCSACVREA